LGDRPPGLAGSAFGRTRQPARDCSARPDRENARKLTDGALNDERPASVVTASSHL